MTNYILKACPFCGHTPDPENYIDSIHKTGIGWRDDEIRHYMNFRDPRGIHGHVWSVGCLDHEGGCGAEMRGDSREEAIEKWNRRTP